MPNTLLAQVHGLRRIYPVGTSWRGSARGCRGRPVSLGGGGPRSPPMRWARDFDTRKLAFLRNLFRTRTDPGGDAAGVPIGNNLAELVESWDAASDKATARLAVQRAARGLQFARGTAIARGGDRRAGGGAPASHSRMPFSSALAQLPTDATWRLQRAWDGPVRGRSCSTVTEAMRRSSRRRDRRRGGERRRL